MAESTELTPVQTEGSVHPLDLLLGPVANKNPDGSYMAVGGEMEGYDKEALGPKKVLMSFLLQDLVAIDMVNETFTPVINIQFDWLDDGRMKHDPENASYWTGEHVLVEPEEGKKPWSICAGLQRVVADGEPKGDWCDICVLQGRRVIMQYYSWTPVLRSPSDLRDFPFDTQVLEVVVASDFWLTSDAQILVENADKPELLLEKCIDEEVFLNPEYTPVAVTVEHREHRYAGLLRYEKQETGYPEVVLGFHMQRNPMYYLRGLVIVVSFVLVIAAASFWLEPSEVGDRLSVSLTMFLTLVAFHFVSLSSLPKISYATRIDHWLGACYLLLFFSNIQNVVMFRVSLNGDFCDKSCFSIDMACFAVYLFGFVTATAWFVSPYFKMKPLSARAVAARSKLGAKREKNKVKTA
eukprot:TRINITY_DN4591_c0_g1_i2.p2 TRINITY_DN4591_c0_g1~~TRINITY_DN4591_c0_g1_i2.p2  ORF type:complete len:409 (-),score=116.13 TRINITY_DN4591_c0_g1_i2:67-1293(-)